MAARAAAAILCLLIFHLAPSPSHAQARIPGGNGTCINGERDALLSFKAGLLDPAGRLSSWHGEDCCQWDGVRCSSRTGHVIKLNLRNTYAPEYYKYSLSLSRDEMSPSLAALQQLRYLDLSWNDFNGASIPVSLGSLENLRLDISENMLRGSLPESLQNMSADQMALDSNKFTGQVPRLPINISNLNMSSNSFSRLPSELKAPLLEVLLLGNNQIIGNIPSFICELTGLMRLDLSGNKLTGDVMKCWRDSDDNSSMSNANSAEKFGSQMFILALNNNDLSGQIPEEISLLIGLTNLNLSSNQLTGKIPNQIGDLKELESLDLSYNELFGEIPSGLSALTSLSHLNLSYNNLSGAIPFGQQLQVLDNLNYTYIGNPGLCGYPLSKNCSASATDADDHEDADHISYLYLGMGIGFVVGLWVVFCTMLLRRTWAIAYFQAIDKLYDEVYVRLAITWARLMKKTQDAQRENPA